MKKKEKTYYLLWFDAVLDDSSLTIHKSISPASNFWKSNLMLNLNALGLENICFCCPVERAWPFGNLFVNKNKYKSIPKLNTSFFSYLNIPFLREKFKFLILKNNFQTYIRKRKNPPKFIITWSVQDKNKPEKSEIKLARHLSKKYKINWLCIIADGVTPPGATHYIYKCWDSYLKSKKQQSYYFTGGVPKFVTNNNKKLVKANDNNKVFMYIGDLGIHGGALELARAFNLLKYENIELFICGRGIRGDNRELEILAESNKKIKIFGYLKEKKLNQLALNAFAFVNPRPLTFKPNLLNFPSKLLYYFSFEKPVLSTISPGMNPEIIKAVIPILNTDTNGLIDSINYLLSQSKAEYKNICKVVKNYKLSKEWKKETSNLKNWLDK